MFFKTIKLIVKRLLLSVVFFGFMIIPINSNSQIIQEQFEISNTSAFKTGEWLQYRLHYGFLNACYASLTLRNDTINGRPVIHAKGYGRTSGLARLFFRVEDYYESYFFRKNNQPIRFIRNIDEGGYTKNKIVNFNQKNKTAYVNDIKNNKQSIYSIKTNTQDIVSSLYYFRNHLPLRDLVPNEVFKADVFFDDESTNFSLKYIGVEVLETQFGNIECLKFKPLVQKGRVFKTEESVTLWVSNDLNKIPIRVQADIAIGSIKCDLENFKNIKHPFKIKIN